MKIYTKKGDAGKTSLIGGTRVDKHHVRIEAYGTVDELNSNIGMLRDVISEQGVKELLVDVQDRLLTIGSLLASDPDKGKMKLPQLYAEDVTKLEKSIDKMNDSLPELKSFVLPGGHSTVSFCHIARCVCRRAERKSTHLRQLSEVDPLIITYLNRLSDYLFVLSRKLTFDLKADEIHWKPRM